jgi:hypothetical protein
MGWRAGLRRHEYRGLLVPRGHALKRSTVLVLCAVLTTALGLAPAGASEPAGTPAGARTPAAGTPATAGVPEAPAPIPIDVSDSIAQGPTEIVVTVDSADGTAALQSAGDPAADTADRQADIARAAAAFADDKDAALSAAGVQTVQSFDHLPVEVVTVDSPEAMAALAAAPGVTSVSLPGQYRPTADVDLEIIAQPAALAAGYTGAGVNVAVIDTGADWLRAGVGNAFGDCSGGPGTGTCRIDRYVDVARSGKRDADLGGHGTNVAGVVAKTAPAAHLDVYGVFPANLVASDTDILTALNDITANGAARGIRAVNMSLGDSSRHTTACTGSQYSAIFTNLRALGILPIVSAGNSANVSGAFSPGVAAPACASGAIPVGATYPKAYSGTFDWGPGQCTDTNPAADRIACFSQGGPLVKLVAPGVDISAAGINQSGTSQAAPHVAGAVADVVCANPHASGDAIAGFLTGNGKVITDGRGSAMTPRRLDIAAAGAAAAAAGLDTAGGFISLTPARLLDTRDGTGAVAGAVASTGSVAVKVTGQCGIPTSGVSAVVLNVTVTGPTRDGYLTAYASGTARPNASNLNFVAGQTVPNLVVAPVGADGRVALYNGAPGTVHIVGDIAGYFIGGSVTAAGAFGTVTPARVLDTRFGTGSAAAPIPFGGTVSVDVTGQGGVPASGVSAVVLTVTVTDPAAGGFITAYASGTTRPNVSNLNFVAGQTVPNLVFAPVGADGRVTLYNGAPGTVQLIADIAGYIRGGTVTEPGAYGPVAPSRLLDTRTGTGAAAGAVPATGTITLDVTGVGGVPATGVSAVVLNVTVTGPAAAGFITAYAAGSKRPLASNLNFVAGQTVPNLVVAPVSAGGNIVLYNGAPGSVHLVADIAGYFLDG